MQSLEPQKIDQTQPIGYSFFDSVSQRQMVYCTQGDWRGWLCFKHPDGFWVSLRKATEDDIARLAEIGVVVK